MSLFDMLGNDQDWQTTQQMLAPLIAQLSAHRGLRLPPGTGLPTHPQQQSQGGMNTAGLGAIASLFNQGGSPVVSNSPMVGGAQYLGQDVGQPWMQGLAGYGSY